MKLKLKLQDRMNVINLFPAQGDHAYLLTLEGLIHKLRLSEKETEELEVKNQDGKVTWNQEKDVEVDIEITDEEEKMIRGKLEDMDKAGTLSMPLLNLCEVFLD